MQTILRKRGQLSQEARRAILKMDAQAPGRIVQFRVLIMHDNRVTRSEFALLCDAQELCRWADSHGMKSLIQEVRT